MAIVTLGFICARVTGQGGMRQAGFFVIQSMPPCLGVSPEASPAHRRTSC